MENEFDLIAELMEGTTQVSHAEQPKDVPVKVVREKEERIAVRDWKIQYSVLILRYLRLYPVPIKLENLLAELNIPSGAGKKVVKVLLDDGLIHRGPKGLQIAVKRSILIDDIRKLFGFSAFPFHSI